MHTTFRLHSPDCYADDPFPAYRELRKLINSGFTRRQVTVLEPKIREIVRGILDHVEPGSTHEFADEIAAPLPTRIIAELIPDAVEEMLRWNSPVVHMARTATTKQQQLRAKIRAAPEQVMTSQEDSLNDRPRA